MPKGQSKGRMRGKGWALRRFHVLAHYNYTCQDCGREGVRLEVHHVDGDRSNNELSNLAPYCKRDHIRLHGKTPPEDTQPDWTAWGVEVDGADFLADESPPAG